MEVSTEPNSFKDSDIKRDKDPRKSSDELPSNKLVEEAPTFAHPPKPIIHRKAKGAKLNKITLRE